MDAEAVAVGLTLALGLWLALSRTCRRRRTLLGCALALGLAAAAAIPWGGGHVRVPEVREQDVTDRPIEVLEKGYASSRTCQACHPLNYATWYASYHRTMTQVPSRHSVVGDFDGVELTSDGRSYRLERRAEELWVEIDGAKSSGPSPRVARRIVLTTGSHHEQLYWYATPERERELRLLPFAYRIAEQRWIPFHSVFLKPPQEPATTSPGLWNLNCIKCHATHGQRRVTRRRGTPTRFRMDTRVAEFGIACEACHGPGERHVRANRDPEHRYRLHLSGDADPTIVHPARLSARLSSEVCGQCHGIWLEKDRTEMEHSRARRIWYQPGDQLADTRFYVQQRFLPRPGEPPRTRPQRRMEELLRGEPHFMADMFWLDGMVRVSGREYNGLIESPCYELGTGERRLSCLSCHTMHRSDDDPRPLTVWANDQLAPRMEGNEACLQCHERFTSEEALTAHSHHPPESAGSQCYNCHMPHTTYGILKAHRSHEIDSPTVAESLETGRPNACNHCHLDRTLEWTAVYLERWYGQSRPDLSEDERTVAASVLWALRGDAGQRALTAWSMGWAPAREASGSDWIAPYLAQLLRDPYDAVRFIAHRSLRRLPGFADFEYDFVGPEEERESSARRARLVWEASRNGEFRPQDAAVLLDGDGNLEILRFAQLLRQRDNRRVNLRE